MSAANAIVDLLVGTAAGVLSGLIVAYLTQNKNAQRRPPEQAVQPGNVPAHRPPSPRDTARADTQSDEDWWVVPMLGISALTIAVVLYVDYYALVQTVLLIATTSALAFILTIYIYRRRHGGPSVPRTKMLGFYCLLMGLGILSAFLVRSPLLWVDRVPMAELQARLELDGVFGLGQDAFFVLVYQLLGMAMLVVAILLASYEAFRILAQINTYLEARPYRAWSWLARQPVLGPVGAITAAILVVASFMLTSGWLASHLPSGEAIFPTTNNDNQVGSGR